MCAMHSLSIQLPHIIHSAGSDSASLNMKKLTGDTSESDPIDDYLRMRYISAPEAAWRIFGFGISQQSPSVARLVVHVPGANCPQYRTKNSRTAASESSSLLRYFIRPIDSIFDNMLYATYYTDFTTLKTSRANPDGEWWRESGTIPNAPPHTVRRRTRGEKVARLRTVRPGLGEVFYIRLLLLHHAARSYEDLRTINGVTYTTFQHAAQAAGLLQEDEEGRLAMEDAIAEYKSASQLRFLFVLLITEGASAVELWDRFKDNLSLDYLGNTFSERPVLITQYAHNRALEDIDCLLGEHGKSTSTFGLPPVQIPSAEIRAELNYFSPQAATLDQLAIDMVLGMSTDQRAIYNDIYTDIFHHQPTSSSPRLHFLTGKAGRGKSFIVKALVAKARGMGYIAVVSGTTALSVSDIDGGRTAHSTFKLPVTEDNSGVASTVEEASARADFLCASAFIVWDELPMANIAAFEAVDALLRRLTGVDLPFGGKAVVAIGDFRQVAPVVKGGGPTACFMASILSSSLWKHFRIHQLTAPMRNASDPEFADFVDSVGENTSGNRINLRPFLHHCSNFDEMQCRLYPTSILSDPAACVRRAFLTPLNVDVDKFNMGILERLPGSLCRFLFARPIQITNGVYSHSPFF